MALEKIISISGQPGLYQVIAQTKYGLIAENLEDKKRIPVYSHYKVSSLADISIYTDEDNVELNEVFLKILAKEEGKQLTLKSDGEVKAYFENLLPTYDKERVYASDMKKLFKWYNLLAKNDLIVKDEEVYPTESEQTPEASETSENTEGGEKKTAKKTAAKKTGTDKKTTSAAPKAAAPKAASKSKGSPKVSAPRKAQ